MGSDSAIVLLTRPQAQAQAFQQLLGAHDVVISPIVKICPVAFSVNPDAFELLVFASQNAVRIAGETLALRGKRAVAVGQKTASTAADLGMQTTAARGNSDALVATIIALKPTGKILFLHGVHTRGDVVNRLNSAGIDTESVVIYDQVAQDLSPAACDVLRGKRSVIMPLFSPRSAGLLAQQVKRCGATARLGLVGMSDAVLSAWDGPPPEIAVCAAKPTAAEMACETLRQITGWA